MINSILLDTSFCIRLLKADDPYHIHARSYFQYFIENKIDMYLSSIVISEYCVKGEIEHLPLKALKIAPFDYLDGKMAGKFHAMLSEKRSIDISGMARLIVKNDCKLAAQIYNRKINAYITADKKSFTQLFLPIQEEMKFSVELIDLSIPLHEYLGLLFP